MWIVRTVVVGFRSNPTASPLQLSKSSLRIFSQKKSSPRIIKPSKNSNSNHYTKPTYKNGQWLNITFSCIYIYIERDLFWAPYSLPTTIHKKKRSKHFFFLTISERDIYRWVYLTILKENALCHYYSWCSWCLACPCSKQRGCWMGAGRYSI